MEESMEKTEQIVFRLILHSGNARSKAYEAFDLAMESDFDGARQRLREAEQELSVAHQIHTTLVQVEAGGETVTPTLLLAHAQDHLMTAVVEINLIERLIRVVEVKK